VGRRAGVRLQMTTLMSTHIYVIRRVTEHLAVVMMDDRRSTMLRSAAVFTYLALTASVTCSNSHDVIKQVRYYFDLSPPLPRGRCILMSYGCLSVCLYVCLSTRISQKPRSRSSPDILCMLPVTVARSSSPPLAKLRDVIYFRFCG